MKVAFYICDCVLFTRDFMKWNGLYVGLCKFSHRAICSACYAFLCAMSHMNGFHTDSVRLRCVIPICIHGKSHPHPSHCMNNFIKSHVKKLQSHTKNAPCERALNLFLYRNITVEHDHYVIRHVYIRSGQ